MAKKRIEVDADEESTGSKQPSDEDSIPPEIDEVLDPDDLSSMFPDLPKFDDD